MCGHAMHEYVSDDERRAFGSKKPLDRSDLRAELGSLDERLDELKREITDSDARRHVIIAQHHLDVARSFLLPGAAR
jgi:hypothetical protein